MEQPGIDRLARLLVQSGTRRAALLTAGAVLVGWMADPMSARRRRPGSSILDRKRKRAERRAARSGKKRSSDRRSSERKNGKGEFSKDCRRFILAAGPKADQRLRHVDDDVLIELIPRGRKGDVKVLLEDDNDSPNGDNGDHLKVGPFTAKVGDRIHIVARNEVVGGCEFDEVWLHCIEGQGGKVKLTNGVSPQECIPDQNRIGVFFDETFRIRNK